MSSGVDISMNVVQRFNLSEGEIQELISKLKSTLTVPEVVAVPMTEEEKNVQQFEDWFKSKLFPPNNTTVG